MGGEGGGESSKCSCGWDYLQSWIRSEVRDNRRATCPDRPWFLLTPLVSRSRLRLPDLPRRPRYPAALEMTRHFFNDVRLEHEQQERLREVCATKRELTPAMVEQVAGEFETVDDYLAALEILP